MAGKGRITLIILSVLILMMIVILVVFVSPLRQVFFEDKSEPNLALELVEGPLYAPEEEHFIFTVEARVSGNPQPDITFNRDDSLGALGPHQVMIYLSDGESFSLRAEAKNSHGEATETIELVARLSDHIELTAPADRENNPGTEPGQQQSNETVPQPDPGNGQEPDQQSDPGNGQEAEQQQDPGNGQEPEQQPDAPAENEDQAEEGRSWENVPQLPEFDEPLGLPRVYREIEGSRLSGTHLGQPTQRNPMLEKATEDFTISSSDQKLHIWLSLEYDNQPGYVGVALQYYDDICCFQYVSVFVENFFLKASDIEERRYELVFPEDFGFERDVIPPGDYRLVLYLENASAFVFMEQKALFTF